MTGDIRTTAMDVDAGEEGGDDGLLRVQEIDAYWLQRRIASALGYSDADAAKSQVGACWGCSLAALHPVCVEVVATRESQ